MSPLLACFESRYKKEIQKGIQFESQTNCILLQVQHIILAAGPVQQHLLLALKIFSAYQSKIPDQSTTE